jgi:DUF1680 family protein
MYSLSYLYQALGDNSFADRAELAAFNALPVQLTPDWWAHQYLTLPNQPYASHLNDTPFWNVNGWGVTFGLEPNYPCCTVNHPQGYPKFLAASFAKVGDNGLAHVLLSPGSVTTRLQSGVVTVNCDTNYPFDGRFTYTINAPAPFDFHMRIPGWGLSSSTFSLNSASAQAFSPDAQTGIHILKISGGVTTLSVNINQQIALQPRANDTVSIFAGPLLYALELGTQVTSTAPRDFRSQKLEPPASNAPPQARDYEIRNTTPWNIAIDPKSLVFKTTLNPGGALKNPIWAPRAPPTWIEGKGCQIDWSIWKGVPGPVPPKAQRSCTGPTIDVRLVPYGSAKVHMVELPTIDL